MAQSTQIDVDVPLRSLDADQTSSSSRTPFRRQNSWLPPSARYQHVPPEDQDIAEVDDAEYGDRGQARGLGLSNVPHTVGASVVKRKPIRSALSPEPQEPTSYRSSEPLSQASTAQNTGQLAPEGENVKWATPQPPNYSQQYHPYTHTPDTERLVSPGHGYDHGPDGCPTRGDLLRQTWSWLTILIIAFAVFSWVFSGILLGIAVGRPRYGHKIGTSGAMSYDSATLLSALMSKLVELTFATTFVAVLGQILSRRAFANRNRSQKKQGISIAEMNMRLWIMQPGTLVTHWTGAKYVITTVLGIVALAAAFAGAFYTTAAEALVSPKLKFGPNETSRMYGEVSTSYANTNWLEKSCKTPFSENVDPEYYGTTCLQIDYAGNGFRNLYSWMSLWQSRQQLNLNVEELNSAPRPPPTAVLFNNTAVQGQWIQPSGENITADSEEHGRLVQNATIAMPHVNVFHAGRVPKNNLLQPEDLQGQGEYYLKAAVPAPGINALCVGAQVDEIRPLIGNYANGVLTPPPDWPNISTPLDALFGWSSEANYPGGPWTPPWFGKLPEQYNTIGHTNTSAYGLPWVYLIAKPPNTTVTNDYVICGIRSFQYSECSTGVHVSSSGSELSVHCNDDPQNWKPYSRTVNKTEEPLPVVVESKDWLYVGSQWLYSVALTQGVTDGNASAARLLTQMIPTYSEGLPTQLDPVMPSIAEALCVLSSYTLLLSSDAAPFVHYWDYRTDKGMLEEADLTTFSAIRSYKDFASGGDQKWKGIFYVVLIAVFVLNSFSLAMLLYYFCLYGEVTDYTEPQNLFALAINSPPSQLLAGACGGGPSGTVLSKKWCVDMKQPYKGTGTPEPRAGSQGATPSSESPRHSTPITHPHFFVRYPEEEPLLASPGEGVASSNRSSFLGAISPLLSNRRSRVSIARPTSVADFDVTESPAVQQYAKLTNR